jgi:hypothetical protein
MGLAFWLAGIILCAGCSQQDPGSQARGVVEKEGDEFAEAARTGAAAQAIEGAQKSRSERSAEAQDRGTEKVIEDGVDDSTVSIRLAGQAEKDAYQKARARRKGQLGAAD